MNFTATNCPHGYPHGSKCKTCDPVGAMTDEEWMKVKAVQEDGCIVSVGGLVTDIETIRVLRLQLKTAIDTLKAIEGHEHCKDGCGYDLNGNENDVAENRHQADGHRCCASIATSGLEEIEKMKGSGE